MFYGQGYAGADDVVGHEMTHGVIERTSGLLYWDEPGAINESLADIIGEIIDHRSASAGDSATDWRLGEDLPDGAARDMADPTLFGQPDRMTSDRWQNDPRYVDNGGVHTNSGVGNKTFHLISQGGSFNGQTVTGIDVGDPLLTKSATLWVNTMAVLTAFTEYADLAVALDQTCTALIGYRGFAAADCASVRKATAATESTTPPVSDPVKDAPRTCPEGRFPREALQLRDRGGPGRQVHQGRGLGTHADHDGQQGLRRQRLLRGHRLGRCGAVRQGRVVVAHQRCDHGPVRPGDLPRLPPLAPLRVRHRPLQRHALLVGRRDGRVSAPTTERRTRWPTGRGTSGPPACCRTPTPGARPSPAAAAAGWAAGSTSRPTPASLCTRRSACAPTRSTAVPAGTSTTSSSTPATLACSRPPRRAWTIRTRASACRTPPAVTSGTCPSSGGSTSGGATASRSRVRGPSATPRSRPTTARSSAS
ncbi:M4 family metallopeptidase [Nocardioides convexus]|uniref:M4 family metallopeptidase n=1 Tax=Nocardioides convexus TaxID=2712224 RepID=UPI0024183B83|nr:M4 family metallopeptidase [Nocardioides convexus]